MAIEIVPIRNGAPSLNDITGQLRNLADRIERGDYGDVHSLHVVMPRDQDYPVMFGFGIINGAYDAIIQFELGRQWQVRVAAGLIGSI